MTDLGRCVFVLATHTETRKLVEFHMLVGAVANGFERRERNGRFTANYTVFEKHLDAVMKAAAATDCTLEEIVREDGNESYKVLVGEPGTGWQV